MGIFSNILSAFQPKKPLQPAQSPVASYQPPKASTPQLFSSAANYSSAPAYKPPVSTPVSYQPPKPTTPSYTPPKPTTPSWAPSNPVADFGKAVAAGNGGAYLQKAANPTFPYKMASSAPNSSQPNQSMVQKTATMQSRPTGPIQASGPDSRFAENPGTQRPVQSAGSTPAAAPAPQMNMLDWFNRSNQLQKGIAANQVKTNTSQTEQYIQMIKDSYGRQKQDLIDQIPYLQGVSNQTKSELLAAADDIRKSGELEKSQAQATYDEATLSSARTKKTTDADRQRMFAALGTLDSTGSMGFTGQQINSDEEFNRVQQNRETEKARVITAIDGKVATAQRTAQNEIAKEASSFQEIVRKIQSQVNATDMDKEAQVRAAYADLEATVNGINDTLATTKQNGELQKMQYLQEVERASQGDPAATTKKASDLRGEYFDRTKSSKYDDAINSYQKIITAPDNAAGDMSMIFGYMKVLDPNSTVREGEYANAQQATGVPGAILNAYNQALAGRRLNPDQRVQFQDAALGAVKPIIEQQKTQETFYSNLARQSGVDPNNVIGGQNILVKERSSGQVGVLPVGEFDANLYERV